MFSNKTVQAAAARLLVSLRLGRGVDQDEADALANALREYAEAWKTSDMIPKSAVNLFVDLAPGIESCRHLYRRDESESIGRLSDEVADLIRRCVAVSTEDEFE